MIALFYERKRLSFPATAGPGPPGSAYCSVPKVKCFRSGYVALFLLCVIGELHLQFTPRFAEMTLMTADGTVDLALFWWYRTIHCLRFTALSSGCSTVAT